MKALVWTGTQQVEVRDVPVPEPPEGWSRIKVKYCGVCGSDVGIYLGTHPRAKAPLVLGHEFIGTVDRINGNDCGLKIGDRVAGWPNIPCQDCYFCHQGISHVCRNLKILGIDQDGGMAEYVCCKTEYLFKLDPDITDQAAVMVEPLAVGVRSMHQSGFQALGTAAVIGAGPIGFMAGVMLKASGASRIIISDVDHGRLELCREYGFETVHVRNESLSSYVDRTTDGNGVDYVFECSGTESGSLEMSKVCRIGGTICQTGVHKQLHKVDLRDINFKEQTLIGSRGHTTEEFKRAVQFAKNMQPDLERAVTQIVALAEGDTVFDLLKDNSLVTVKIVVDCENI